MRPGKTTTAEAPPSKSDEERAGQLEPCQPRLLEAETADSKPAAAGLGLRSTSSKC